MSSASRAKRCRSSPDWQGGPFSIPIVSLHRQLIDAGFSPADVAWMLDLPRRGIGGEAANGERHGTDPTGR